MTLIDLEFYFGKLKRKLHFDFYFCFRIQSYMSYKWNLLNIIFLTSRDLFDLDNFEEYFFRYLWYGVTSLDLKIILLNSWDIISIQIFNNFNKMKIWPLSRTLDLEWPSVTSKFTFSHNLTLKAFSQIYWTIFNKG